MKELNLTIVCSILGVDFDKKSGEKTTKYQATILYNKDNKSYYTGVKTFEVNLHEELKEECKKHALKYLNKKESDYEKIDINVIII